MMSPQEMRETAARTIEWMWQTQEQGYGDIKEVLRSHIDTEAREHLQGLHRIHAGVPIQAGDHELIAGQNIAGMVCSVHVRSLLSRLGL
jgi:hypothetical protein